MFSIITIAPSIIAPIAIAMPPRDMMSAPTPTQRMAMNAIRMPIGSVRIATSADRACSRNTMQTRATTTLSSRSLPRRFSIARSIRSLRSYTGVTTTPGGRPALTCSSFALTPWIVSRAFSPNRITTMPPTASPRPSSSAMPRRTAGPMLTRPSSATRTGVPFAVAPTTTFSMSADRLEVAQPADHVLALRELHDHGADVGVGVLDRGHDRGDRDAVALQLGGIEIDLVLLLVTRPAEATSETPGTAVRA